jgi:hypothetical protein
VAIDVAGLRGVDDAERTRRLAMIARQDHRDAGLRGQKLP